MKKVFAGYIFSILCIFSLNGQDQNQDRYLIHPKWDVDFECNIATVIKTTIIDKGDTTTTGMEANQRFIVKEKTEKGYIVDWISEDFILGNLPGFEAITSIIDSSMRSQEMPILKIRIDKWGYPKGILNLEEMEAWFNQYFDKIMNSYSSLSTLDKDSFDIKMNTLKNEMLNPSTLELQLKESITSMFLPYDYWIPKNQQLVDSGYVNIPNISEPVKYTHTTNKKKLKNSKDLELTSIIKHLIPPTLLPFEFNNEVIEAYEFKEVQSFKINERTTKIEWTKIEIDQTYGNTMMKLEVKYTYK